ncbi:YIP1 family protein [Fertoebacter nigrum]|uniref:YIP1 family protein n=1 Tax=Fertoeibacter niger TaxID=2656921 RepID=A0A8X8H654_9RHOB|nr:YIP1 family protein [Fertoeibacter niger]NUB43816.1 YIP1 family protein [Fertoeibacter niger]
MPVTADILESYRRPRAVIARKLAAGLREDRALATLMGACGLIFVAQWPGLARAAHLEPSVPLDARIGGALMGVIFLLPPLCYLVAAGSHLVARALGGKGSFFGARLALFQALLAVTPLMLLQGLVGGFIGPGPAFLAIGLVVLAAFGWIWVQMLIGAETWN